jgi:hypothetical protein
VKLVLVLVLALGAVVLVRRGRGGGAQVNVAWRDGAELDLRAGSSDHARLVPYAERVLG